MGAHYARTLESVDFVEPEFKTRILMERTYARSWTLLLAFSLTNSVTLDMTLCFLINFLTCRHYMGYLDLLTYPLFFFF